VLSILYIVFAGLIQMSYLNVLFAIVMYAGMYFGLFWLLLCDLPAKVGIAAEQVASTLIEAGQGFKFIMFASPEIIMSIVVPMSIFALFGCGSLQMPIQAAFGAKDLAHVRKGLLPAAIVNSLSTVPWAAVGVVASAIPAFAERGPSFGPIDLMSSVLHPAVLATIMISLLVANISTSGGHVLAATIVGVHDIYRGFINPEADERKALRLSRLLSITFSIAGGFIAYMLHVAGALIIPNLMWTSALALPGWFLLVYGFWWKRSLKALIYSWVSTWIIVGIWSFIPRSVLLQYVGAFLAEPLNFSLLISFVLTTVLTAVLPGEKGYFRR
jgi:Na+/proline symporter